MDTVSRVPYALYEASTSGVGLTTTIDEEYHGDFHRWYIVIPILFLLIAFVGISGNSLVIFVIAKHRDMRTVTNYFVGNLAITDISLLLICDIPTSLIMLQWQHGNFICKFISYMQGVSTNNFLWFFLSLFVCVIGIQIFLQVV